MSLDYIYRPTQKRRQIFFFCRKSSSYMAACQNQKLILRRPQPRRTRHRTKLVLSREHPQDYSEHICFLPHIDICYGSPGIGTTKFPVFNIIRYIGDFWAIRVKKSKRVRWYI